MVATFVRSGYQNRARVRVEDPDLRRSKTLTEGTSFSERQGESESSRT